MKPLERLTATPARVKMLWHLGLVIGYVGALIFHGAATRRYWREMD